MRDRFFQPRQVTLVWGLSRSFDRAAHLFSFVSFFVRSESPFLRPDPRFAYVGARRSCQGWPLRTNLAARSAFARPHLDSFEHDGTLDAIGMTIRGEPAFGRGSIAPQPCIRWVQEPDHAAAMRIGSEAPRRRTHSSSRHDSHESPRDPATSNRHRRPRHKWTD